MTPSKRLALQVPTELPHRSTRTDGRAGPEVVSAGLGDALVGREGGPRPRGLEALSDVPGNERVGLENGSVGLGEDRRRKTIANTRGASGSGAGVNGNKPRLVSRFYSESMMLADLIQIYQYSPILQ